MRAGVRVPDGLIDFGDLTVSWTVGELATAISSVVHHDGGEPRSPVSSIVGLEVLDVIRDEGLQHNAAVVGEHRAGRLRGLTDRHPIIGAVHGLGLYLGVDPESADFFVDALDHVLTRGW